jgi:hypothetical protein
VLSNAEVQQNDLPDNVFFAKNPENAISVAKEQGCAQALLIGGGKTNGAFFKLNLIDEVCVVVHPLAFGRGINLFEGFEGLLKLEKTSHPRSSASAEMKQAYAEGFPKIGSPAYLALKHEGISLTDLPKYSEKKLLSIHGVGPKAVGILREFLVKNGLSFKERD